MDMVPECTGRGAIESEAGRVGDDGAVTASIGDAHVPALLSAFALGSAGALSDGPVASGRLGSIWRLDTNLGSWAVKQVRATDAGELTEILEGAAFQERAI